MITSIVSENVCIVSLRLGGGNLHKQIATIHIATPQIHLPLTPQGSNCERPCVFIYRLPQGRGTRKAGVGFGRLHTLSMEPCRRQEAAGAPDGSSATGQPPGVQPGWSTIRERVFRQEGQGVGRSHGGVLGDAERARGRRVSSGVVG